MFLMCKDASNAKGTGVGLLTEGKKYHCIQMGGGYYSVKCDDGKTYTKCKSRFVHN